MVILTVYLCVFVLNYKRKKLVFNVQLVLAGLQTKKLIKEPLAPIGGKNRRQIIFLRATQ